MKILQLLETYTRLHLLYLNEREKKKSEKIMQTLLKVRLHIYNQYKYKGRLHQ